MTTAGRSTVVAVFDSRAAAERAVDDLERAGFTDQQIGFAMRGEGGGDRGGDAGDRGENAAGGAVAGAATGGVVGGILGALAAGLIPGIGPVIAAGILAATLGGAAAGAAAGGLLGALTGLGVPEEEARYYHGEFEQGRPVVTVRADGQYAEASEILIRNGGRQAPGGTTGGTMGTVR